MADTGIKILVVDDDRQLADTLTEFLSKLGYQAATAYGGREGLELFEQGNFQLLITDLMMPEMDGMELLAEVKKQDSLAVVLVITGVGTVESAVDAMNKGAYDFIPKPVKLAELGVIIERAMERYEIFRKMRVFRRMFFSMLFLSIALLLLILWFVVS